ETTKYGPFGEVIDASGTSENFLKYTGREHDEELGLYYYRARYYDPDLGRFLTEDPIGFDGGINFYAYVGNNPINFNDPEGLIAPVLYLAGAKVVAFGTGYGGTKLAQWMGNKLNQWFGDGQKVIPDEPINQSFKTIGALNVLEVGAVGLVNLGVKAAPVVTNLVLLHPKETCEFIQGALPGVPPPTLSGAAGYGTGHVAQRAWDFVGEEISTEQMSRVTGDMLPQAPTTGGASGGFVLYPNKPNINMMQQVYSK
ncbi:MAG: RHS repeat-associated core domain-containing protein, partial [Thermodesulfobacteriota bacterium]|nr:RHS repeat-associated core domain-containing protein [Thermodesulfobacteriota bacterium]